ncbi:MULTISPECIES: RNA ligase family protein [Actinomadura]|uniref:RNA ligase family protein n=1 Tax=Actinomadura yumaensis TaxID=111807 RepID=A0ABW2CHF9_9ACTN|nr:RNA ligase family protein [Actinomadura sp. J1-007]MWK40027.1 DNA ligase [Actinomadura sp. J1-007]
MLRKYPRTRHIEGSRLQPGDHDLASVPFREIAGRYLVVEEKLDGANAGISFSSDGGLRLQSRGHFLAGGPRERQFGPLKAWASSVQHVLRERLGDRYVLYGEWLYAKHTMFYDALPHYFCAFDVLDRSDGTFLSTARRRELLDGAPVVSVPVLHEGPLADLAALTAFAGPSTCRTGAWRDALREAAVAGGADPARVADETDRSDDMEGLYIKVEEDGRTVGRCKWVRPSFLTAILDSGTHWQDRPIVANGLADPEVLYAGVR